MLWSSVASFVFTVLFWPGTANAAMAPRWAFLMVVAPLVLFSVDIKKITLSHVLLGLVLLYAGVSFSWSIVGYDWAFGYAHLFVIALLFVIGAQLQSLRPLLIGAVCGLAFSSVAVVGQKFLGWTFIDQVAPPAGLYMNKTQLGEISVLVLVACIYERMWWALPVLLPSFIIPESRSSYVAFLVVMVVGLLRNRPRLLVGITAVAAVSVIVYCLRDGDPSVMQRFYIWCDTLSGYSLFGSGWGQFYAGYPNHAYLVDTLAERPDHAHNDLLEIGYELGIGALLVVAFAWSVWRNGLATEKAVFLAFVSLGCFGFPLYMPESAAIFALVAGRLAGSGPALRDDVHHGRVLLRECVARGSEFFGGRPVVGEGGTDIPVRVQDPQRSSVPLRLVDTLDGER